MSGALKWPKNRALPKPNRCGPENNSSSASLICCSRCWAVRAIGHPPERGALLGIHDGRPTNRVQKVFGVVLVKLEFTSNLDRAARVRLRFSGRHFDEQDSGDVRHFTEPAAYRIFDEQEHA